jgi:hypothetical protein
MRGPLLLRGLQGHNQITDLYLLALAVCHGGCLVSFDQGIALSSVRDTTPKHLLMLERGPAAQAATSLGTAASSVRV